MDQGQPGPVRKARTRGPERMSRVTEQGLGGTDPLRLSGPGPAGPVGPIFVDPGRAVRSKREGPERVLRGPKRGRAGLIRCDIHRGNFGVLKACGTRGSQMSCRSFIYVVRAYLPY